MAYYISMIQGFQWKNIHIDNVLIAITQQLLNAELPYLLNGFIPMVLGLTYSYHKIFETISWNSQHKGVMNAVLLQNTGSSNLKCLAERTVQYVQYYCKNNTTLTALNKGYRRLVCTQADFQRPCTLAKISCTRMEFWQIEGKFILVFEKIFCRNQKKCYIPENFSEREAIRWSAPSQKAPFHDFSPKFLGLITTDAAISSHVVFICFFSSISQGFMGYG